MWIVFVIIGLINCRLLQRDSPQRGGPPKGQHQSTLDEIFTYIAKSLDQDQQSKLENVQMYIFEEGLKYYAQSNEEQQTKILNSFVGMLGELEKQNQQEEQRIEQDIKYFSSLSNREQDILLTVISQSLKKQLEDSTKQFNSSIALQTIENEIEQFQKQPNKNIQSTWNITQFEKVQEQKEKDLQLVEYQIQEFFDQGLNKEQIKQNISNFISQFLTNSTSIDKNDQNLQELIEKVTEKDQNKDSTNEMKELRQKVRLYIRDLIKQGKTEQETEQLVEKFINDNGIGVISEEDKQRIQRVIHKEFLRYERQKEFLKATEDQNKDNKDNKDQNQDDANSDKPTNGTVENNSVSLVVIIIGILGVVTIIGFLIYIVRRQVMKIKINSGRQQAGFSNPDLGQDIEQMD